MDLTILQNIAALFWSVISVIISSEFMLPIILFIFCSFMLSLVAYLVYTIITGRN